MNNKIFDIQSAAAPDLTKLVETTDGGARDMAMLKALQLENSKKSTHFVIIFRNLHY